MPLTKEEIEKIAEQVADKVSKHSICQCGFSAWHRKTDFEFLEKATSTENSEWVNLAIPHVRDAIADLERDCYIDLKQAKKHLESCEDFAKTSSWDEARDAAYAILEEISDQLYLCSGPEEV